MKQKIKAPLPFRIIQWGFPKLEKIAPKIAGKVFSRLFFTAFKYPAPKREKPWIEQAHSYTINYNNKEVMVYEWGEGKPLLFVHGWMGRAGQFSDFVSFYTAKGYKCISFDAVGHGQSEGNTTNLLEMAEIIEQLQQFYPQFEMVVGHSLGGAAVLYANSVKSFTQKIALISSPSIPDDILTSFCKTIHASEKNIPYLLKYIKNKSGMNFHDLSASQTIKKQKDVNILIIHDEDDSQVHVGHAAALIKNYPTAQLIKTQKLGHNRILRDEHVIQSTSVFMNDTKHAYA